MPDTLPNPVLISSHLIFTRALFLRRGRGYMIYCRLHNYDRGRAEIWIFLALLITVSNTSNDSFHLLNACYVSWLCCSEKSIIILDVVPRLGMRVQSCPTLCNFINSSLPGSSVHEIFQARILEWVTISSSGDLPAPGIKSKPLASLAFARRFFTTMPPGKPRCCPLVGNISFSSRCF